MKHHQLPKLGLILFMIFAVLGSLACTHDKSGELETNSQQFDHNQRGVQLVNDAPCLSGDGCKGEIDVTSIPNPPSLTAICRGDEAVVGSNAWIDCSASYPSAENVPITQWSYELLSNDCGSSLSSSSFLMPNGLQVPINSFVPDCEGTFVVRLTITDALGTSRSTVATVETRAIPLQLTSSTTNAMPGSNVEITVEVDSMGKTLGSAQYALRFPSDTFTYINYADNTNGSFSHLIRNLETEISSLVVISTSGDGLAGNIQLTTFTFQVEASARAGLYAIKISPSLLVPIQDSNPVEYRLFESPLFNDFNGLPINFAQLGYTLNGTQTFLPTAVVQVTVP